MNDIFSFLPLGIIVFFAIALMLLEVLMEGRKQVLAYVSFGGTVLAALSTVSIWNRQEAPFKLSYFSDMFVIDNFSLFFYLMFLLAAGITSLIAPSYLKNSSIEHGEFYSLMLFSVSGMMLMASAGDLLTMFLGLEIMSIAVYVMVGFKRYDIKSNEAILKYFFLGAFSAGFILYGIALLYGACETTNLVAIKDAMSSEYFKNTNIAMIGILLMLIGILFKVAAAPFHIWTPDVYDGAPAPVTGFMITAVKAASFAMFLKLFLVSFSTMGDYWRDIIIVIAIITMFVGNIYAFTQENIKRMLAYSSISHTGYLMIGVAALGLSSGNGDLLDTFNISNDAANAILYYLAAYTVSSLGIFACVSYLSHKNEDFNTISDYAGLGFKYPLVGIAMAIFMLSLIGVPPTGGFFGKYYLFSAAIKQGMYIPVMIALINSMLSIYYYLKVIVVMYFRKPVHNRDMEDTVGETGKISTNIVLAYTVTATLWLGMGTFTLFSIIPGTRSLIEWSRTSIASLF